MALPERKLGKEGFFGSAEGYGAMSLTNFGQPDHAEGAEDTLRHVLQSGVTVINTAVFYGQGENEKIIGEALIPSLSCSNFAHYRAAGTLHASFIQGCQYNLSAKQGKTMSVKKELQESMVIKAIVIHLCPLLCRQLLCCCHVF